MSQILSNAHSRLVAMWDRIARACASLNRATLAWGGLAFAAVILLSVNLVSSISLRGWQADLTEGQVFTITDGTRDVLAEIEEPINVRLYFSKGLGELAPSQARYFERVRTLLENYRNLSGGKVQTSYLDPEPFSAAEDRAVADGLRGVRLNAEGELGYFGLVATNSTDNKETIPFFAPDRDRFLEYDVTKLIHALAKPKKRVVGLMTALPINGGKMPMSKEVTPPWLIMEQLHEFFDLRVLDQKLTSIPSDIDVLMIANPYDLTPKAAYAVDQYVLGGGKALVFVDPVAETSELATLGSKKDGMDELNKLLNAWGLDIDRTKVAADIAHARRVQLGQAGGPVTQHVAWLVLDKRNIDQDDVLSVGLETLNLASAGYLKKMNDTTAAVTPFLHTSPQAMIVESKAVGLSANPLELLNNYEPGGNPLALAARVTGAVKSAFPDGAPGATQAKTPKNEDGNGKDTEKKEAAASGAGSSNTSQPHLASGNANVIVIADTDLMADRFWVEQGQLLGQSVVTPTAHNAALVIGALENLSGNDALIALRARGVTDRPFTLVEDLRRDAERQFREREEELTKKLQGLQQELAKIETSQGGSALLSEQERKAADRFRAEMLATRRALRDVKLALRRDIDRLDGWLKFANIALVPLAIGFGGVGWSLWRTRRRTAAKQ